MTYLTLPQVLGAAGSYAASATWDKVAADVSRTVGEYSGSRMAHPELLASDVGFQLGSIMAFKGVTGLAGRGYSALASLPGEPIGSKGLAVFGGYGEGPLGFKQILQVSRQRAAGAGSDVLGPGGLATVVSDVEAMPLKQLLQVARQKGSLGSDVLGFPGIAAISGGTTYLPLRQTLEVSLQRATLRNIMAEPVGVGGVAAIGSAPALLPFKQLGQVLRQRATLGSDVLGPTGMGTRGVSLKALLKFAGMPGAVEPFTGVAHRGPAFSTRDISGILQIKAKEQAEFRAGNLEAFMRSTFAEPRATPAAAKSTSVAQILQMGTRGGSPWAGAGAVDVFPYEVLSYPPDVRLKSPVIHVEQPRVHMPQVTGLWSGTGTRQSLREDLTMKQIMDVRPELTQHMAQRADQDLKDIMKMRQPQALRQTLSFASVTLSQVTPLQEQRQLPLQAIMSMPRTAQRTSSKSVLMAPLPKRHERGGLGLKGEGLVELRVDPLSTKGLVDGEKGDKGFMRKLKKSLGADD